jgi:DNA-binding MarR family transcriptional regulator
MQEDEMVAKASDDIPPTLIPAADGVMIGGVDIRDVASCACLALRRTGRIATQIYDAHLQASGLTVGQFGVLARIYGSSLSRPPLTMKELSNALGLDPTTLNRTLKPLEAQALISSAPDQQDRRVRCIRLTAAGRERLARALPLWRAADDELRQAVGAETALALGGLLNLATEKLRQPD